MKTMKHLSSIAIKSTINQEMNRGFKTAFSTNRETLKPKKSQHWIVERARNKKAQKRSITREREIVLDLKWYKHRHSESTDDRLHHCFKNGLHTHRQTKAFFTVWQTLALQSREHSCLSHCWGVRQVKEDEQENPVFILLLYLYVILEKVRDLYLTAKYTSSFNPYK